MGVNMSKFCMQCGKEIEDSADICTFCGAAQGGGVTSGGTDTAKNTNKALRTVLKGASIARQGKREKFRLLSFFLPFLLSVHS